MITTNTVLWVLVGFLFAFTVAQVWIFRRWLRDHDGQLEMHAGTLRSLTRERQELATRTRPGPVPPRRPYTPVDQASAEALRNAIEEGRV